MNRWFGTARFAFNKTVEYLRQEGKKANWMAIKGNILSALPEWAKEVPYQIKSIAIKDACTAVKNAKRKFKLTGKVQRVKFRSKKNQDYNLFIPKSSVSENGFYHTLLGEVNLREKVGDAALDCRVILENGRYFLVKPESRAIKKPDNQRFPVVALDPGVRTFQTLFTPNGVAKIGKSDFAKIFRLCVGLDKLSSLRSRQFKSNYVKASRRVRNKIRDLISEIHHKLALALVKSFDVILLPTFETSSMVTKLHSKVARAMLSWAHFRFKSFLKCKAEEYSCEVIDVNESYTSKTCSVCGMIHDNLKGKKILKCSCGLVIDRDFNGARGIFLKNFSSVERSFPNLVQG